LKRTLKDHRAAAAELLKRRDSVRGVRAGFSFGVRLDAEIARRNPRIYARTRTDRALLNMLRRNRIDHVFMAREEADHLLQHDATGVLMRADFDGFPLANRRYPSCAKGVSGRTRVAFNALVDAHEAD